MNACIPPESLHDNALNSEMIGQTELLFERADLGSPDWWQAVAELGTPLRGAVIDNTIELTFLWRATEEKGTEQVFIDVYSHTPHISESLTGLTRIGQTDVWYWRTRLPLDWRGSYFFLPAMAADLPIPEGRGLRRQWWINLMERSAQADPLNPISPHNGSWGLPLSGIDLSGGVRTAAINASTYELSSGSQGWDKLRWASEQLRNERDIWFWDSRFIDTRWGGSTDPVPLVLLLDGHYWAQQPVFIQQLENMTRAGQLPVAQYVFIDALSPLARSRELPCNPTFWIAVQEELLPLLHDRYGIAADARQTLIAGQSFGGLSAVFAALHWPERFGQALSLSGSFWWPDADETGAGGELVQQLLDEQSLKIKALRKSSISLSIGSYEQDMLGVNQAMRDALKAAKIPVTYREFRGGHDWLCWREELLQQLPQQLSQLLAQARSSS